MRSLPAYMFRTKRRATVPAPNNDRRGEGVSYLAVRMKAFPGGLGYYLYM